MLRAYGWLLTYAIVGGSEGTGLAGPEAALAEISDGAHAVRVDIDGVGLVRADGGGGRGGGC